MLHPQKRLTPARSILFAIAMVLGLAACGSDDDAATAPAAGDDGSAATETGDDAAPAPAAAGPGTGTLTMADGTVYGFEMSTCDTSDNAEGFTIPNSYDLFGRTSDGSFSVSVGRAGFDEETVIEIMTFEGDFDENGQNAKIYYTDVTDTLALTVDGGNVTGTVSLKPIETNRPHGDLIDATVDIRC